MSFIPSHGSYRAGALLQHPNAPSMDQSFIFGHDLSEKPPKWIEDFYKIASTYQKGEPPRPTCLKGGFVKGNVVLYMKKITPCWTGGLNPFGDRYLEEGFEWVMSLKGNYFKVPFKSLTTPSDEVYNEYFKKILEQKTLIISTRYNKQISSDITLVKKVRVAE
jgi:hypothetical protein